MTKEQKAFWLMALCALAIIALATTGCSSTNITKYMEAAGHDSASTVIRVMTPYGSGSYSRMGPGQTGTISPDGSLNITGTSTNFTWPPAVQNNLLKK